MIRYNSNKMRSQIYYPLFIAIMEKDNCLNYYKLILNLLNNFYLMFFKGANPFGYNIKFLKINKYWL